MFPMRRGRMDSTDILDRIRALPCASVPHPIYRIYCYRRVLLFPPTASTRRNQKMHQFKKEKNRVQQKQGHILKSVLFLGSLFLLFRPLWYLVLISSLFCSIFIVFPSFRSQFIRPHRRASVHVPVSPPFSAP